MQAFNVFSLYSSTAPLPNSSEIPSQLLQPSFLPPQSLQLCVLSLFLNNPPSPVCAAPISWGGASHWSVIHLSGTTPLKPSLPSLKAIAVRGSSVRGGGSCAPPCSKVDTGLVQAHICLGVQWARVSRRYLFTLTLSSLWFLSSLLQWCLSLGG